MSDGFEAGVGFNGIAVALLARNSPVGAVVTAILFSSLNMGATSLQAGLDVPASLAEVLQGAVIVLVLIAVAIVHYRQSLTSLPIGAPVAPIALGGTSS
jgi:simple sugar transport system permease protein